MPDDRILSVGHHRQDHRGLVVDVYRIPDHMQADGNLRARESGILLRTALDHGLQAVPVVQLLGVHTRLDTGLDQHPAEHIRPELVVLGRCVLLEEAPELLRRTVGLDPLGDRGHVIDEGGIGPALRQRGCGNYAGIEQIEVRHGAYAYVRITVGREPHSLPGKVFQISVGSGVHDDIGLPGTVQPVVCGQILMGGRAHGIVQNAAHRTVTLRTVASALGLDHEENVTEGHSGDEYLPISDHGLPRGFTPSFYDVGPDLLGQGGKPFVVFVHRHVVDDPSAALNLARIGPAEIGHRLAFQDPSDDLLSLIWHFDGVAVIGHRPEDVGEAVHYVEVVRFADVRLGSRAREVVEYYRDLLLAVGLGTELHPADDALHQMVRPLGDDPAVCLVVVGLT